MNAMAKKLQVKASQKILILGAPSWFQPALLPLPENTFIETRLNGKTGQFNLILLFVKNREELADKFPPLFVLLSPDTILWIAYPKKRSGISTDLNMMGGWDTMEKHLLRPVASASLNEEWTAIRFKPGSAVKKSAAANEQIKKNEYGNYVDVVHKKITLPSDIKSVLDESPAAASFFDRLSYTNKKEYVIWILSARQEATKLNRLQKMRELLECGRKNPSDKGL